MIEYSQIDLLCQQIADKFDPERIILFGSYAIGKPNQDSDVDLLVIFSFTELPVEKAIEIRQAIRPSFPLDLLARTPEQIQQRLALGDFFIQNIINNGQVLYETNHTRMD